MDAQDSDGKIDFIVLVDDVQVLHTDSSVSDTTNRKITVPFSKDSSEIRVIGTHAIPEFGTVALIVFAVAISATVLARSRMQILKPVF